MILYIHILMHFRKEIQMAILIMKYIQIKVVITYHTHSLDWQKFEKLKIPCVGKDVDEWEFLYICSW